MSSPTEYAILGAPALLLRLRALLESSGLECSPYIIDASGNTPSHLTDSTFSLDLQSDNSGDYRNVIPLRMAHTAVVTLPGTPRMYLVYFGVDGSTDAHIITVNATDMKVSYTP